MKRTVRIGGACGFLGDSTTAAPSLIAAGVDYLMLDYLAEVTMSMLAQAKRDNPKAGYPLDFTDWIWKDNLRELMGRGVKVITNAGGINPHACRDRMMMIAAEQGFSPKIAVIEGDDLLSMAQDLSASGIREMFKDTPMPEADRFSSINAYLGGGAIAKALAMGADAVITGRVVDSALALGPLMHEFGWGAGDYDQLSSGTLVGHILECGAQSTGGLHTDWRDVPDWAHIGYPIAEVSPDGSFVVSKPDGTGGLVSPATVAEQMLYEVGDPQAYIVPDVVCDFSQVVMTQAGENRVQVSAAIGRAPTATCKVCATFEDGWRVTSLTPVLGMEAAAKAQRQGEAILIRTGEMLRDRNLPPWRASRVDVIGADASYGLDPATSSSREVLLKMSVEHDDAAALKIFNREYASPITSMSVGTTGWFGLRPQVMPLSRLYSFLLPKSGIAAIIDLDGQKTTVAFEQPAVFDPADVERPAPPLMPTGDATLAVPLIRLAWGRSGDKGDGFNVGILARKPEYLPWISAVLTSERVGQVFAHEFEGAEPSVQRFEVPGMLGLNFLLDGALGGGGVASQRIDMLAKGKAQQLLETLIPIPADLLDAS